MVQITVGGKKSFLFLSCSCKYLYVVWYTTESLVWVVISKKFIFHTNETDYNKIGPFRISKIVIQRSYLVSLVCLILLSHFLGE